MRGDWNELFVIDWRTWFGSSLGQREKWCAWLRHHGIDPNHVLVPGWIAVFRADRQIHYWGLVEIGPERITGEDEVVVQLEAEPSRFPTLQRQDVQWWADGVRS